MQLFRTYRTVRHLKPLQIQNRLKRKMIHPKVDLSPAPVVRVPSGKFVTPARRAPVMLEANTFRFLNELGKYSGPESWNDSEKEKLWLYNLHYFDDLNAHDSATRLEWHHQLMNHWIEENPPGTGNGWEPYPLSMRIVNWIKWNLGVGQLESSQIQSLAVQVRFLEKSIEWHLLGNHLWANAKAIAIAGMFFGGEEGDRWLKKGMGIIREQIREQVLKDGGHFERSLMYHSILTEDFLDLFNLSGVYRDRLPIPHLEEMKSLIPVASSMVKFLEIMCHPDRRIVLFNDSSFGISASPEEIFEYANRLQITEKETFDASPLMDLRESGYFKAMIGQQVLFADTAPLGPDYLPGHAHADVLSFECSVKGRRILVDSGTSVYGTSEERIRQRGTKAHNCLVIDEQDSSEVWSGFRVGRRSHILNRDAWEENELIILEGTHDGYKHLSGSPIHKRRWTLEESSLEIHDTVQGRGMHAVELHFHFHPEVQVNTESPGVFQLQYADGRKIGTMIADSSLQAEVLESTYHPEFGVSLENWKIVCKGEQRFPLQLRTRFEWATKED